MSEAAEILETEVNSKIFVVQFRGGLADGELRIALKRVPPRILVKAEEGSADELYHYLCEEPQMRDVTVYDKGSKAPRRARIVEAFYQIFVPAKGAET